MNYAIGDRVNTPHGPGVITGKDICRVHVDHPEQGTEWTGRWLVLHDTRPPNRLWMGPGGCLAYWPEDLTPG